MMQIFVSHLKALFDGLFRRKSNETPRGQNTGESSQNHGRGEGDRELREYELFYWSAASGSWY
ncbi:hypothetical protein [Rhizobium gallicum]|uniref:hypothetical protein n=1 Tax=Rhizobium gallicum TaxID=56730 RepID=UPI000589EAAE|nr:hypothetical protein [Rhizobium gallicum]TDW25583.1 hypothetical protein EV128_11713 [Rhizobium azibense]